MISKLIERWKFGGLPVDIFVMHFLCAMTMTDLAML